jgi:hypothetical protein
MKPILIALATTAFLLSSGCTTVASQEVRLPMSKMNHCAEAEGLTLRYGTLTIALGERPNTGYGLELVGQSERDGEFDLLYREIRPQPGRMYAQVITQPCLQVILPKGWHKVTVKNQQTGDETVLTPAQDRGSRLNDIRRATEETPQ